MNGLFQGDPAIKLTADGADLVFKGGQPVMDPGLENQVQISLFTREGWPGNFLLPEENQIGSGVELAAEKPITLSSLIGVENAVRIALAAPIFGKTAVVASNPESYRTTVLIRIEPPGGTPEEILLLKDGQNWINQAQNPAHKRF